VSSTRTTVSAGEQQLRIRTLAVARNRVSASSESCQLDCISDCHCVTGFPIPNLRHSSRTDGRQYENDDGGANGNGALTVHRISAIRVSELVTCPDCS